MKYCNWKATMTFNFFGFKKRPDIEDVVPKEVLAPEPPIEIQPPTTNEVPIGLVTTREDVIAAYKIFLGRDLPPPSRTKVMEQSPLISENSGYETIQIYR